MFHHEAVSHFIVYCDIVYCELIQVLFFLGTTSSLFYITINIYIDYLFEEMYSVTSSCHQKYFTVCTMLENPVNTNKAC